MDGMDRKIEKGKGLSRKTLWYLISAALFLTVLVVIIFGDKSGECKFRIGNNFFNSTTSTENYSSATFILG